MRDLLLRRPSKDIDILVVGNGIELAGKVVNKLKQMNKPCKFAIFKNFGTAQIKLKDMDVEFVGARKESYRSDSRKPIVEDGTLQDDQNRRDFTINTLALCLNKNRFGELIDPFNGLRDLQNKVIRTPLNPDITFSDDPLRMMRCIRFAAQLNFFVETNTFEAIGRNKNRMEIISKERITDRVKQDYSFSKTFYRVYFARQVRFAGIDFSRAFGAQRCGNQRWHWTQRYFLSYAYGVG